ncbi:MAG: AlwI family type II restriction endonuclease [Bacilli bacterium]|nr:AlwI family type II restriction endonuclease [Bacilli bacterium]
MAQQNRSKEVWLIPKRVSLHQTICLIDGIIERNFDGSSWNPGKQNNLGVNLKNWGATRDGKNISSQAIRTLTASIPQYLGFLYINTQTTPNTIKITEAGYKLWEKHKGQLEKITNLVDGKEKLINESDMVLSQMEKLQITNPIILKDCENILVFPFRATLALLLELDYLDIEELALFVFRIKDNSEIPLAVNEIKNFRKLDNISRKELIENFKKTHIGNITLVQAGSTKYYQSLCVLTGIIEKTNVSPTNRDISISSIKLKNDYKALAENIVINKYKNAEAFDFENNLNLWIEYIGNVARTSPPVNVTIINKNPKSIFINLFKNEILYDGDIMEKDEQKVYPMFIDEEYKVQIITIEEGNVMSEQIIIPKFDKRKFDIIEIDVNMYESEESFEDMKNQILSHSSATHFAPEIKNYLTVINKLTGVNKLEDKSLRGAYYEYFFFKLLCILMNEGKIDNVVWNGKIGKYGLPVPAPGGKIGITDIIFTIGNIDFVLELTTIRAKSTQFSAEGSSVPDHIKLHKKNTTRNVIGIFVAPIIHDRNTSAIKAVLRGADLSVICVSDTDFLEILSSDNISESLISSIS